MKKRVLSLLMAVMMLVALVVPASATTDTSGTVTVYVTYGMFTEGGIGEQPAYRGGIPTSTNINANFYISDYTISISDVSDCLADAQSAYAKPTTTPSSFKTPNVLDALLVAFWLNGTDITDSNKVVAGWDANPLEGNPGGYINGVYPQYATYGNPYPDTETINGVVYNKYSGSGWNIAYGSNAGNIAATGTYSTNVTLTDGMIIVFDFSPYCIYEVQSNS